MVRDSRIKEYTFSETFSTADTVTTIYSDYALNGKILDVNVNFNNTGSVALSLSGIGLEIFRNNAPSGTNWSHSQPREFTQSTTGSIAGAEHVPFLVNGPLALNVGSMASGTTPLQVIVRYI